MELPIEEYFKYHPPKTEERKAKHDIVNKAALELACAINNCVVDEDCKKMAFFAVQQARIAKMDRLKKEATAKSKEAAERAELARLKQKFDAQAT